MQTCAGLPWKDYIVIFGRRVLKFLHFQCWPDCVFKSDINSNFLYCGKEARILHRRVSGMIACYLFVLFASLLLSMSLNCKAETPSQWRPHDSRRAWKGWRWCRGFALVPGWSCDHLSARERTGKPLSFSPSLTRSCEDLTTTFIFFTAGRKKWVCLLYFFLLSFHLQSALLLTEADGLQ